MIRCPFQSLLSVWLPPSKQFLSYSDNKMHRQSGVWESFRMMPMVLWPNKCQSSSLVVDMQCVDQLPERLVGCQPTLRSSGGQFGDVLRDHFCDQLMPVVSGRCKKMCWAMEWKKHRLQVDSLGQYWTAPLTILMLSNLCDIPECVWILLSRVSCCALCPDRKYWGEIWQSGVALCIIITKVFAFFIKNDIKSMQCFMEQHPNHNSCQSF